MNYSEKLKDPRWQKKRLEILTRDEWECQECGDRANTLHVHHIAYSHNPWETENDLLITLCETCHKEEEANMKSDTVDLINELRNNGFMSAAFRGLSGTFADINKTWSRHEPVFDIIKMFIEDKDMFSDAYELYFKRLSKKNKSKNETF